MKDEIIQRIAVTLNALNSITVSGKTNLANLSGSITMLEEIGTMLSEAEIKPKDDETGKK